MARDQSQAKGTKRQRFPVDLRGASLLEDLAERLNGSDREKKCTAEFTPHAETWRSDATQARLRRRSVASDRSGPPGATARADGAVLPQYRRGLSSTSAPAGLSWRGARGARGREQPGLPVTAARGPPTTFAQTLLGALWVANVFGSPRGKAAARSPRRASPVGRFPTSSPFSLSLETPEPRRGLRPRRFGQSAGCLARVDTVFEAVGRFCVGVQTP